MTDSDKYATWKGLAIASLSVMVLTLAIFTLHTARPHDGTASQMEFMRISDLFREDILRVTDQARDDRKSLETQLQRVENKIDNVIRKLN